VEATSKRLLMLRGMAGNVNAGKVFHAFSDGFELTQGRRKAER
jgi:hypothetical protein